MLVSDSSSTNMLHHFYLLLFISLYMIEFMIQASINIL